MDVRLHPQASLGAASDVFVTFLYAASVHLLVAHSVAPGSVTVYISGLVLLCILHIFSDWLSRVRLPRLLPPTDVLGTGSQLVKTTLEVVGLFFLVLAWLTTIEYHVPPSSSPAHFFPVLLAPFRSPNQHPWTAPLHPQSAFAVFLFATFLWNLFLFRAMRRLDWPELARIVLFGNGLDSNKVTIYARRFLHFRNDLELWVRSKTKEGSQNAFRNLFIAFPALLIEAVARSLAQLVAIHITWVSLVGGLAILVADCYLDNQPVGIAAGPTLDKNRWVTLTLAAAVFLLSTVVIRAMKTPKEPPPWPARLAVRSCVICLHGAAFGALVVPAALYCVHTSGSTLYNLLPALASLLFFFAASQFDQGLGRKLFLGLGGAATVIALLVLYLLVDATQLMAIIAGQQVIVNVFLQYAASDRSIRVLIDPVRVLLFKRSQQFVATVIGTRNPAVTWTASAGNIDDSGLYEPPGLSGEFRVYALADADETKFGEATVIVPVTAVTPGGAVVHQ